MSTAWLNKRERDELTKLLRKASMPDGVRRTRAASSRISTGERIAGDFSTWDPCFDVRVGPAKR